MTGRRAAQPDPAWRPVLRRRGLIVTFVSEDGAQSKDFDFGSLPGNSGIRHDFAIAFEDATGVLGSNELEFSWYFFCIGCFYGVAVHTGSWEWWYIESGYYVCG